MLEASGSVAEWSKALVLGTSLFRGVGSNPTAAKFRFLHHEKVGRIQLDWNLKVRY